MSLRRGAPRLTRDHQSSEQHSLGLFEFSLRSYGPSETAEWKDESRVHRMHPRFCLLHPEAKHLFGQDKILILEV